MWNLELNDNYLNSCDSFCEIKSIVQLSGDVDINPYNILTDYPVYVINITYRKI